MADAIISVVAERVAAIIEDQIRYEVNLVRGVEKEVLDLSDKLKTIRNVLGDAEKRGVNDQSVKSWLKKLEATAYEMDDILDEWNYALLKHKMKASAAEQKVCCSFIPSSCLCFKKVVASRDTSMKIENVKSTVDQILVLDDVWTGDYNKWKPLKINLNYGAPGSKILVTTRNERVAKMMGIVDDDIYRPQQLSDEECWLLLRCISLSGRSEKECGEFEEVGKKIASKCKGLPLAANVLGSLLQFKYSLNEWENVWKSEIWELEKAEVELFPHLVLSYNELSPVLRRCFSYCAVYSKDSQINAKSLIEQWMALGYLGSVGGNGGLELKGREYLNTLAMLSLLRELVSI